MKVLLDTHALLWLLDGDVRLTDQAKKTYKGADSLHFSTVNLWEIGIKLGLRRKDFALDENWWRDIPATLDTQGVLEMGITAGHCREVSRLPLHHRDPFDRLLIAQARVESCAVLSADVHFDDYGVQRIW